MSKSKERKGFNSLEVYLPANFISKHDNTAFKYLFTLEFPVGFCLLVQIAVVFCLRSIIFKIGVVQYLQPCFAQVLSHKKKTFQ